MRYLRDPENIFAALLIVAFFLPWASFLGTAAGYELPELGGIWFALWALPVLGVAIIVLGVLEIRGWRLSVLTGLLPFVILLLVLADMGSAVVETFEVGSYLTLLAGFGLIASAVGKQSRRASAPDPTPDKSEAAVPDKHG